jgi:hypothetical protein
VDSIVRLAGDKAKLGRTCSAIPAALADQGTDLLTMQDYMGRRDPKRTAHYTGVAGRRFEGLWR